MPARPAKVCHRCGQDLKRQRRYRDHSGYWCVACSKADKKAYRASHLPCDDCGCDVQRGQERLLDNHRLCGVCWQKRQTEALRQQMDAETVWQKKQRGQQQRRSIWKWSIAGLELMVACVLVSYVYPWASDAGSGSIRRLHGVPRPADLGDDDSATGTSGDRQQSLDGLGHGLVAEAEGAVMHGEDGIRLHILGHLPGLLGGGVPGNPRVVCPDAKHGEVHTSHLAKMQAER